MKTEMTWNEFCELYFDTAKKTAEIYLQKQKNKLGQINPRVDLDYVRDTAVLSAMEKAYAKYDSSKGAKITTFLSTLVHNSIVDTLEKESKEAAKQQDIDDVKTIIKDIAEEGSDGSEARKKLIPRLREAIDKLSPSDQIILFHYLEDKKNYVAKSAEALQVSENYVSVRRNRIFKQLPKLMEMTRPEYMRICYETGNEVFASDVHYNKIFTPKKMVLVRHHLANPIMPALDVDLLATMICDEFGI